MAKIKLTKSTVDAAQPQPQPQPSYRAARHPRSRLPLQDYADRSQSLHVQYRTNASERH